MLLPLSMFSQSTYFEKVFGSAGIDISRSVKQINSGSIFVFGNSDSLGSNDLSLTKLDANGNRLWTKYYGTGNTENGFFLNTTNDGNLVFTGETETASNNLDVVIGKVDTTGAVLWYTTYASPVNETGKYIEQTTDGGYIIAGAQNDALGLYDILVLKLDANGNYQWHQPLGRSDNEYGSMIHEIPAGYILTADTRSYGAGGYDVILYDLDTAGNEIWSQTYGDSLQNGCQGLLITSDGKYLSYGETEIAPSSAFDFFLEKIDTSGTVIWRYTYGGSGSDAIFSVKEDVDGGFICTGYSNSYNGFAPLDLVIFKVDAAGTFQWKQTYGGSGIDIGYEIIRSINNNGFIITGKTVTDGNDEFYLLKLDNNGLLSGISSMEENSVMFDVFPNPAAEAFFVHYRLSGNADDSRLQLYNMLGEIIYENKLDSPEDTVKIDVSALGPGIYFCVVVKNGEKILSKKIVIEN